MNCEKSLSVSLWLPNSGKRYDNKYQLTYFEDADDISTLNYFDFEKTLWLTFSYGLKAYGHKI